MSSGDYIAVVKVSDCTGDTKYAVISPGGKSHIGKGIFEQLVPVRVGFTMGADLTGGHICISIDTGSILVGGESRSGKSARAINTCSYLSGALCRNIR